MAFGKEVGVVVLEVGEVGVFSEYSWVDGAVVG